jgi:hypothetical protein
MKRYVKALQILCLVFGGLRGCVVWLGGEGWACLSDPVSWIAAMVVRAVARVKVRGALAGATPQAALTRAAGSR